MVSGVLSPAVSSAAPTPVAQTPVAPIPAATFRLALLLAIIAAVAPIYTHAAEATAQPQAELAAVTNAITSVQTWLLDANDSYSTDESNLREAELRINTLSGSIAAVRDELARTQSEQSTLQQQSVMLELEKSRQNELLQQLLRAAYISGNQSLLKLLLNQEDPAKGSRMLHYYRSYSASQLQALQQYQSTLDAIATTNTELATTAEALLGQETELQNQLDSLASSKQARQLAMAQLQESIRARNAELEQLQVDQLQLQQLIEVIQRAIELIPAIADTTPFTARRGELPLPMTGIVVQSFGSRYGEGNLRRQGISISAPEGTSVRAVHAGRVVFADWLRGAGLLVIVDHGDGYMSLYGNNQALAKTAGDLVATGEVIATSGNGTVNSDASLYFEIRHHGTPQDPAQWLADR